MKIAVYGAANIDIQAVCYYDYVPADSNPGRSYIGLGGVGRNIAENCARLGMHVDLVTVMGDDELSSIIAGDCTRLGIGLEYSLFLKKTASPRYIAMMNRDGSLIGAVAAMDALDLFNADEFKTRTEPGDNADIVVIDANLPEDVISAACGRWKSRTLFLDPVSETKALKAKDCIGSYSIIKPNLHEAMLLAGLIQEPGGQTLTSKGTSPVFTDPAFSDPVETAVKCADILYQKGVAEIFISLGPDGILYYSGSGCGMVRPLDMPVVNVSGAGDAASAGIVWACTLECDTAEKAKYAAAMASLAASNANSVSIKINQYYLKKLAMEVKHEIIA